MTGHVLATMNETVSYGYCSDHKALDVVGSGNTVSDVISLSEGTVEVAVNNMRYTNHNTKGNATYGNYIVIKHPSGYKTLYAHLEYNSISVNVGDYVSKGQRIARMGQTGNAYGVHLHFEIRAPNGRRINPYDYLFGSSSIDVEKPKEEIKQTEVVKQTEEVKKEEVITAPEKTEEITNDSNETITGEDKTITDSVKVDTTKDNTNYLKNTSYNGGSIVDGLKGIGIDSSFAHRTVIAHANGLYNYTGTYDENVYLLKLLKEGNLVMT